MGDIETAILVLHGAITKHPKEALLAFEGSSLPDTRRHFVAAPHLRDQLEGLHPDPRPATVTNHFDCRQLILFLQMAQERPWLIDETRPTCLPQRTDLVDLHRLACLPQCSVPEANEASAHSAPHTTGRITWLTPCGPPA